MLGDIQKNYDDANSTEPKFIRDRAKINLFFDGAIIATIIPVFGALYCFTTTPTSRHLIAGALFATYFNSIAIAIRLFIAMRYHI